MCVEELNKKKVYRFLDVISIQIVEWHMGILVEPCTYVLIKFKIINLTDKITFFYSSHRKYSNEPS